MKCPYCSKKNCEPPVIYRSIENYGSARVRFPCCHCKKVIEAYGERLVKFSDPRQTNEESDW